MASKNESLHPPRNASAALTSSANVPGVTGRTPDVPESSTEVEVTLHPTDEQARDVGSVAHELESSAGYRDDFSAHAPERPALVTALQRAKGLSDEAARAQAWARYLTTESQAAWQTALSMMGQLQGHFEAADASSPNIALRYPYTHAFFGARSKAAIRAAATRRRKRDEKQPG